ncbi:hypothetical protein FOA52_012690 [Chlamydomonas sp. UWO 241]|nr:hypothetical protein FOA52_012690 [Chlamydomonas sp. UWO 241]
MALAGAATGGRNFMPPLDTKSLFQDDQEDAGDATLEAAVAKFMQERKDKVQQKSARVISEVHAKVDETVKALEAQVAKEAKDQSTASKKTFGALERELNDRHAEITKLVDGFKATLSTKWREYSAVYEKLDEAKATARAGVDKRRASLKRKLDASQASGTPWSPLWMPVVSQPQGDINKLMIAAEEKLKQHRAASHKIPDVLKVLEGMM